MIQRVLLIRVQQQLALHNLENAALSSSTAIKTLLTAYFTNKCNTLIAQDASGKTIFEINLTAGTVACYVVNASNVRSLKQQLIRVLLQQ